MDLLEDYLWESSYNPQVRPGFELYFCEAAAVIIRSGIAARTLREFCAALRTVGLDSIYYHFVESRRRLGNQAVRTTSPTGSTAILTLPDLVSPFGRLTSIFTPCRKSGTPCCPWSRNIRRRPVNRLSDYGSIAGEEVVSQLNRLAERLGPQDSDPCQFHSHRWRGGGDAGAHRAPLQPIGSQDPLGGHPGGRALL